MGTLQIPYKEYGSFDLVVVGGGCTGVCAAVRAARLGLTVAIVEKSGCFGGRFFMARKVRDIGIMMNFSRAEQVRNETAEFPL